MDQSHRAIEQKLNDFYVQNRIPHIILYGPTASGKKHILMKFLKTIYVNENLLHSNVMFVNCAHGKGIKFIREELKFFAKTNTQWNTGVNFKSIVLLNAEHLTVDAQSAMRRCIEQYSNNTRFFVVITNKSKLLVPILSRFCEIYVPPFLNAVGKPVSLVQEEYKQKYNLDMLECTRQTKIGEIIRKHVDCDLDSKECCYEALSPIANEMYENAYCVQDLLTWIQGQSYWSPTEKASIGMEYMKVKSEFRCEKLLMLYLLDLLLIQGTN